MPQQQQKTVKAPPAEKAVDYSLSKKAFTEAKSQELMKQNGGKLTASQLTAKLDGAWAQYQEAAKKANKKDKEPAKK
jgi:hypothetical protein